LIIILEYRKEYKQGKRKISIQEIRFPVSLNWEFKMDEEDRCIRCDRGKDEVKLLDAVSGSDLIKVCEECSMIEDIPVIRMPSSSQLQASEKPFTVRQRLNRMAGLKEKESEPEKIAKITKAIMSNVTIDSLRKPKDYRQILDEKFKLARKRNVPVNLIDNFNWYIAIERKKRKMDRRQLAGAIGESETVIKMIETKEMPDDASRVINKIEQYFGIKLRKDDTDEPKVNQLREKLNLPNPVRVLNFDKEIVKNITISDLKRMKEMREKGEKEIKKVEETVWGKGKEEKSEEDKELVGEDIEFED